MKVWIVTPHMDTSYDDCILPVEGDEDGRKAKDYAKDVLENLWDTAEDLEDLSITVSIRRGEADALPEEP